jgi:hypothetical protein
LFKQVQPHSFALSKKEAMSQHSQLGLDSNYHEAKVEDDMDEDEVLHFLRRISSATVQRVYKIKKKR